MLTILNPLRELTLVSVLVRFLLAALCGGVIGIERGRRRHAAGLRTHAVVCIGAASVMMVNQYLMLFFGGVGDPARMGAQVISGIGFLGAGTIIVTGRQQGQRVKGLTTAAGLWASACMGLAAGIGFYEGAVIMCVLLLLIIAALTKLDDAYVKSVSAMQLYLELRKSMPLSNLLESLRQDGWHMTALQYLEEGCEDRNVILLDVRREGRPQAASQLISCIKAVDGVLWVDAR